MLTLVTVLSCVCNGAAGNPTVQSTRDASKGIMSNTRKEYTELADAMKQIHQNVYQLIDYFDAKYSQ